MKLPVRCLAEHELKSDGFDVSKVLDNVYIKDINSPWTRKIGVYHPSAVKGCHKALYYDRIGESPARSVTTNLMSLFDLGHAIHDVLQARLSNVPGFEAEAVVDYPPLHLFGRCDGVFRKEDWILEIKTIGDSSYNTLVKPHEAHIWQVHCYMFGLDIPRAQILYVNRNNGKRRTFTVKFSNQIWGKIVDILMSIEDHIDAGTVPEGSESKWTCGGCKFRHVCQPTVLRR